MSMLDVVRTAIASLQEQRDAAVAHVETFEQRLVAESRSELTETEDAEFTAALAAVRSIDEKIAAHTDRLADLEKIAAYQATNVRRAPVPGMAGNGDELDYTRASLGDLRGAARKIVDESRNFVADSHRESVTKLLEHRDGKVAAETALRVLTTSTDAYIRAWGKLVSSPVPIFDGDEQAALLRAMTAGTGSSGGYAVPTPIDPTMIITGAGVTNPIRELATVRTLADGLVWKGVTAAQVSASYDSEGVEVSDDSPTLSQPLLTTVMARLFVPYSIEASMDIPGLTSDLAELFADAKVNLEGGSTGFWSGSGSGQPYGLFTEVDATTASRVAAATASTYAVADVYSVNQGLPDRFRNGNGRLAWAMNVKTINSTRQFATSNNYHFFLVDGQAGAPRQLLGERLVETSAITSTVTTGNSIVLFGDFSRFLIMDKIGMTTELIPHMFSTTTNLPSGQRGIFAWFRHGSRCLDVNAFRTLRL